MSTNINFRKLSALPSEGVKGEIYFIDNGVDPCSIYLCIGAGNFVQYSETARELLSNKTTSLSSSSTDVQYPTAKTVYTELSTRPVFTESVLSPSVPDPQIYTKPQVDFLLSSKEDIDNKTTNLSSSSTDEQYPTAKVVYDKIEEVREMIAWTEF